MQDMPATNASGDGSFGHATKEMTVGVQIADSEARQVGVMEGLRRHGLSSQAVSSNQNSLAEFDAMVASAASFGRLAAEAMVQPAGPPVVVFDETIAGETQSLLERGASAVIGAGESLRTLACGIRLLAASSLSMTIAPTDHLKPALATFESPPLELQTEERQFLQLLTHCTIEEAGRRLGYSRRQIQRRYSALCKKFGFSSHLDAAVSAARWGL